MARRDTARGIVIGLGIAVAVGVTALVLARAGRPAMRAMLRTGGLFIDKGRELGAELAEVAEDFVAEVRAEWDEGDAALEAEDADLADYESTGNVQKLRER